MLDGEGRLYNAIDTDHNGMLLRVQDKKELKNYLKNCQNQLHLKVGARVVVRRNITLDHGWVNGTIAQIVSLNTNCIVLCQIDNPKERLALPCFKQIIQVGGSSCYIV